MDDKRALLRDSGLRTRAQAIAKAKEIVNALNEVVLHIAITGETGVGKSSFVNAIRGVQRGDEGWAPTGVTETTMEPKEYPHPSMPNVRIWDLPGIGTSRFKAKTYMKDVKFETYDFFIIVSSQRFKENDLKLATEIKKNNKKFYFVRSKIDSDMANEGVKEKRMEEKVLLKIRKDCEDHLRKLGQPPIFLISSFNLSKYDFPTLVETLKRDLPSEKRNALEQSLPVYSMQSLNDKYSAFKETIWALAVVSAIGAGPLPGLSVAVDTAMVLSFLTKVYHSFGLDDKTLEKLSNRMNKPIREEVKKSKLIQEIGGTRLASTMLRKAGAEAAIEVLSCVVPVVGNVAAAGLSFVTTRAVLQEGLDELYGVAKKVLEMANLQ
ncbi:interferon-inducible GTPase 5-like [Engraulis encrasicolus]|uniref:interferon-inducible GTPase 5-like n=1 Tax=Engraulis encrasicolus TaxID=184585 RepID=UPI002FCE71F7